MKDEIQFVYDELVKLDLIKPSTYQKLSEKIEAAQQFWPRDLFVSAFSLSIANMIRTSASFGFDEEHLTASLAGSLGSNLTWFARAYRNSKGILPLPHLRWVHQTKMNEARSGIDLGLLLRAPGKDADRPYRLVLLQAKLASGKDLSVSIDHLTNKKAVTGTLQWSQDALTVLEAAASSNRPGGIVPDSLRDAAFSIAQKKFVRGTPRYQLETLLRTDLRGQSLSGSARPWCFYVAWHNSTLPRVKDVRDVASSVWLNGSNRRLSTTEISKKAPTLMTVVDEAMYQKEPRFGLEIPVKDLGRLIDYIVSASPDIRILTNSVNPKLDYIFDRGHGYRFSDSLIPSDLLGRRNPVAKVSVESINPKSDAHDEDPGSVDPGVHIVEEDDHDEGMSLNFNMK